MTNATVSLVEHVNELLTNSPSGFALAFHISFTTPRLLIQKYEPEWVKYYSENGLIMSDPTVLWGFENDGVRKWSELEQIDSAGVLKLAKDYEMNFGLTCALTLNETRTIGSFARPDREFDDDEVQALQTALFEMHKLTDDAEPIDEKTRSKLEDLAVQIQSS